MRTKKTVILASLLAISLLTLVLGACKTATPTPTAKPSPAPTTAAPTATPTAKPTATPTPTASPSPTAKPAAIQLKYAHSFTADSDFGRMAAKFMQRTEELSGGRVKWTAYPSNQLVNAAAQFDAVKTGTVDMVLITYANYAGKIQLTGNIQIAPFAWKHEDTLNALHKVVDGTSIFDMMEKEFNANNMKQMMNHWSYHQDFMFRKMDAVKVLEDWKGKKVRTYGAYSDEFVRQLGGSPVVIPSADVYMAAQTGTVDGVTHSLQSYLSFKEQEVLPYVLWFDGLSTISGSVVSLDTWNKKLDNDLRAIFTKVAHEEAEPYFMQYTKETNDKGMLALEQKGTIKIYRVPEAERNRWAKATSPYYDDLIKKFPKEGPIVLKVVQFFQDKYAKGG